MEQPEISIRKRIPIRTRFLRTVMLTTILSILAVSITGFVCIRWIRSASEKTLTEQLENNLKNIMLEKVHSIDVGLEHYKNYIAFITDFIGVMYDNEEKMIANGKMFYSPVDTHEFALTRAFASPNLTEEALEDELLFYSNLENVLEPIAKENEDTITTIYLGTKDGLLVSYDKYSWLSAPTEGTDLIYNYFVSEWYRDGIKEDNIFCTDVYMDFQGRGLTITIGSGFTDSSGELAGVACMDFDLSSLYDELFFSGLENGTFTFVLDNKDTVISSDSDMLDLQEYTGLTLDQLDELKADPDGIMEINDSFYVCLPLESVGWTLCACVPKDAIQESIYNEDASIRSAAVVFIVIVLVILLAAVIAVNKSVKAVTDPLEMLGRDIKIISDGDLSYRASVYRNDEIGDITSGMNEMVDRLNFTLNELMSSQQHADAMSRLATLDTLTGVRNKTAFTNQMEILGEELAVGEKEFGFAMLDLNNLKVINDNYGHTKGDITIQKLCGIIGEVFAGSLLFRVGGDEFVVLLKNDDYQNVESLVRLFKEKIRVSSGDKTAEPWNRISAAIGYALYDENLDDCAESVLARADQEMYTCKKIMKSV